MNYSIDPLYPDYSDICVPEGQYYGKARLLGSGSYGIVYKVKHNGKSYAAKHLHHQFAIMVKVLIGHNRSL